MLYYSQKPNSHSLGFQSLSRKAVPVKCMLRKAQTLAGTEPCLELCWIIGTLLEPCCNLAGKSLKSCRNLAGAVLELCWNLAGALLAGTLLESHWNFAGTFLDPGALNMVKPCWNLAGTSGWNILLGTNAGVDFVFLFTLLLFLMCRVVRLEVWLELCWSRVATLLLLEPI